MATTYVTHSVDLETYKYVAPLRGQVILVFDGPVDVNGIRWQAGSKQCESVLFKKDAEYVLEALTVHIKGKDRTAPDIEPLTFRVCSRIVITLNNVRYNLDVKSRSLQGEYVFFEVQAVNGNYNKTIKFKSDINATFFRAKVNDGSSWLVDYDCMIMQSPNGDVPILFSPNFTLLFENSVYNPVHNNITGSVESTYTKQVEIFRESVSNSHYSRSLEKVTTPATVPDSFYTSLQNILGRYLGSKNTLATQYEGQKWELSNAELSASMVNDVTSVSRKKDLPFFSLQGFTGSLYPAGTEDTALKTIGVSEMILENLYYTTLAGYEGQCTTGSTNRSRIEVPRLTEVEVQKGTQITGSIYSASVKTVIENNLPRLGTILYRLGDKVERLTNLKVYSPDLGAALKTNDYGIVTDILEVKDLQVTD